MILLTEEKRTAIILDSQCIDPECPHDCDVCSKGLLKAQLKKVVEYLEDDFALAHDVRVWNETGRVCKPHCRGCEIWQSLLAEVK